MVGMNEELLLNDLVVVKRSGQRVNFNSTKIAIAIKKAFDQVMPNEGEKQINKVYEDVLDYINVTYSDRKTINVEDIQDIIETKLKENKYNEVYYAFSDYRERRAASRKAFAMKQQHKFTKAIERIVQDNKENKNANRKPNEILVNFGKTVSCEYTKTYVLDNKLVRAHDEGSIYIHNLDYFHIGKLSSTHLLFEKAMNEDFPNQLISIAIQSKFEIDGEIAIDSLDELLIPIFVTRFKKTLKDKLSKYLEVAGYLDYINFKKIEELIDKENKMNFDIDIFSQFILNERVKDIFELAYNDSIESNLKKISGDFKTLLTRLNDNYHENKKYSISIGMSDSFEGMLVNNCYLNQLDNLEKLSNVTTIFKIKKEHNSELLNRVSKLIVDGKNIALSFVDSSYNADENSCVEYFSNGKRIFENPIYEEKNSNGRMIVSSVSVNMGRLGFKYSDKELKDFYLELDELLDIARNGLVSIFETIGDKSKDNYRIIFDNNILDDDKLEFGQKIRKVIKKGVLNLELAGLSECVFNLEKDSKKQKELLYDILKYVEDKCKKYTVESKLNFVVSETCKHRPLRKLMELDKAIYGIKKNITDKSCYERIDSLFDFKKDIKDDLKYIGKYQKMLSGGSLVKIELSKNTKEKQILEFVKVALEEDVGFLKFEVRK